MNSNRLANRLMRLAACGVTLMGMGTMLHAQQLTPEQAAQLSQNVNQPVIVILKNQPHAAPKGSGADLQRFAAISADQAPLLAEFTQVKAVSVKAYHLVNALAATVSQGEVARLQANPAVAQVIPDSAVRGPKRPTAQPPNASTSPQQTKPETSCGASCLPLNVIPGACGADGQVLLAPEGIALTNTDSQTPGALTARSLGLTGAGVKVAWIADGIDVNNPNFMRPQDGLSVFDPSIGGDYRDFTGDGPNALTEGSEAFLDSNTIAGQGIQVYDVSTYTPQPDLSPCNVTIEGVAPGASLVGLKIYVSGGEATLSTNSMVLEAIDYAVETDHIDVLNESFGGNPFPDITSLDVFKQFNEAAVAAGVVVVASSGDAGPTNTIDSPASDPLLISVGATTQFQAYAQSNFANTLYFATTGWLSNNIAAFSSSGFTQTGTTIDLVAPGDQSWTSCTPSFLYVACNFNFLSQPTNVQFSGGTSESAPFVSGAAALVIQAYRQTHGGASPTPAVVKQILISSAGDLGTAAKEQGAGLLNTYQAGLLAESISTADGSPSPVGNTLLVSPNQLNAVGAPGQTESWSITVTNTGANPQVVTLSGRVLGSNQNVQTGSVTLNPSSSPYVENWLGYPMTYATFPFNVPAGVNRLTAAIAYPPPCPSCFGESWLILVDPQGRFAANSWPQGESNFGGVDVISPAAGTWTGVVMSADGTSGSIPWQVETENFVPFGSVTPSTLNLAAGQSQTVTVSATTPSLPGDAAGSVVVSSNLGGTTSIPVTLRSLIEPTKGGTFSGVLTGGNGRSGGIPGQVQYYEFNVGPGVQNITANVSLTNDAADTVELYLIGPSGDTLGYATNAGGLSLTAYTLRPVQGTWTLILELSGAVVGDEVFQSFTGYVKFNAVNVSAAGLPNSASDMLPAGVPVTIPVTITNNGGAPEQFFIDARLNKLLPLQLPVTPKTMLLPLQLLPPGSPYMSAPPVWIVPTETKSLKVSQGSTAPAMFDASPYAGDPDLASSSFGPGPLCSTNATLSYSAKDRTITAGSWIMYPTLCGPYTRPAPTAHAAVTVYASTQAFDPTITSTTGDFWLNSLSPCCLSFTPLTINPGQTGTINVTITPAGTSGTVIQGTLYVNDYVPNILPYNETAGDELAALPYTYTIQ